MNIKTKLMSAFHEIVDVYREKVDNDDFLRVQTNLVKLKDIEILTHKVSQFLDQIDYSDNQYYLDIFSSGHEIPHEKLKALDEN